MSHPERVVDLPDAVWRKSTRSGDTGGSCVEVAALPDMLAVRDSKDPGGPVLRFARGAWSSFVSSLRTEH